MFKPSFTSRLPKTPFLKRGNYTQAVPREPYFSYVAPPTPELDGLVFPYDLRFEHCFVPGKTGHGKTTLLQNMALQDIENGAGVTFIDPGGDAVKQLLNHIPEHRKKDCIWIDFKNVIPFQIFNFDSPLEKDELVRDLTFLLLKGIPNAPSAEDYLQRLCYTLLDCTIPVCFLDAYYFLTKSGAPWGSTDNRFEEIIANVPPKWRDRWNADFPKDERRKPILIRLEPLANNSITEKLFGTLNPKLNIAEAMNSEKIMLVDLGGAGQTKMEYGALFFSKMKQEIFKRSEVNPDDRVPHFLYVDEFETFANPQDFSDTLKMARKYRLSLTLASLSFSELDSKLQSALGIISSYILFCLHPSDLSHFKHLIDPEDLEQMYAPSLTRLPKYRAIFKLGNTLDYRPSPEPLGISEESYAAEIIRNSLRYCAPSDPSAQSSTKRTGDNGSSNTSESPHNKENGTKDDNIPPSGSV